MPGNISPDETIQDIVVLQQEKAAKRFLNVVRNKLNDINRKLWANSQQAFLDQHAGKAVPYCFSKWYGPIRPTTPRRQPQAEGGSAFTEFAILADDKDFLVPRNTNIIVNREGAFYLERVNCTIYASRSSNRFGNFVIPPNDNSEVGNIFDGVFTRNGGGNVVPAFRSNPLAGGNVGNTNPPTLGFDVVLYDRKRGRRLHDFKLPMQYFDGFASANKQLADPIRFDTDTEIEPRLFVNVATHFSLFLQFDENVSPNRDVLFFNLFFKGYKLLEVI